MTTIKYFFRHLLMEYRHRRLLMDDLLKEKR